MLIRLGDIMSEYRAREDVLGGLAASGLIPGISPSAHPERYILGKPHPDRARQFKPFAALKGYEELVEAQIRAHEDGDEGLPANRESAPSGKPEVS